MSRRESYINSQFSSISSQFETLFDQLGLTSQQRDDRERQICNVIAQAMEKYLQDVTKERDSILQECLTFQSSIKEMVNSLKDIDSVLILGSESDILNEPLKPPYNPLLQSLKVAYDKLETVFTERLEKVNKLLEKLKLLATEIDGMSVPSKIMPARTSDIDSLDLSNNHIEELSEELERWENEKISRVSKVSEYGLNIVNLWVELGTLDNEIDSNILNNYKTNPYSLGIMKSDLNRLKGLSESLQNQKDSRIKKLTNYKHDVQVLWNKLGEDNDYIQNFEKSNRGISLAVIEQYSKELERLNEKKKQHIHVFIQDCRKELEALWDKLYFSEQETSLFTPAWTDIYTDASLDAHENEIERLNKLLEERAPVLSYFEDYQDIQKDEEELQLSMHDASRLLSKGPGRRDPGRLLKEEQMRKRIAKRKPKVLADLKQALVDWEQKSGNHFKINGQDLMEIIRAEESKLPTRRGGVNSTRKVDVDTGRSSPVKQKPTVTKSSNPISNQSSTRPQFLTHTKSNSTQSQLPTKSKQISKLIPPQSAPKSSVRHVNGISRAGSESPTKRGIIGNGNNSRLGIKSGIKSPTKPNRFGMTVPTYQSKTQSSIYPQQPPPSASNPAIPNISRINGGKENKDIGITYNQNSIKIISDTPLRVVSSGTTSSENWETYDEASSSEDENSEYSQWRQGAINKLAYGDLIASNGNRNHDSPRVSEFNWDKDTF